MGSLDLILEIVLVGLLAITLVHAIRLERALGTLRQDRTALGEAIAGFDSSTRQAEAGINKLQAATADTAQLLAQRLEQAATLREDLQFLIGRGESIADRLDGLVRTSRTAIAPAAARATPAPTAAPTPVPASIVPASTDPAPKVRSQAERDLLLALRGGQ